jgi:hypothetical protein
LLLTPPGAASINRFRLFFRVAFSLSIKLDMRVALKNSHLTRRLPDDGIIIFETAH